MGRPPIGPVPDEAHATFERALAREVLTSLGPVPVKGHAAPIEIYRLA